MAGSPIPDLSTAAGPPRRPIEYTELNTAEDPIGVGGEAVVYRATLPDGDPPNRIALKEPKGVGTLDSATVDRFLKEAARWETLDRREREKQRWSDSEHIVGIVDTGDQLPWIAMEYMDGGNLRDRLANRPDGLPVDEALWVGECICRGIELAHNYGIAHLDLKPANVLFRETADDTWDVPKIADWGLARLLANETGTLNGLSVEYAAPEQFEPAEFGDPDMLTDIYQAGAVVYALLTGEAPYTGSQVSIMHDVVYGDDPVRPGDVRRNCPVAVDRAVEIALSRSKRDRYRSIATFAQALEAIRTGQSLPPVVADRVDDAVGRGELTGTSADRSDGWLLQANRARTGYKPDASPVGDSVAPKWQFETDDSVQCAPAVVDGTVYVGSDDTHLYAVDAATGTRRWQFETGGKIKSSPAVVDDTVYVGSTDDHLYAVDAADGTLRWRFETDDSVISSPAVVDGTVFFGSNDTHLYAVNAADGSLRWRFETGHMLWSSPAVVDGTVYVGSHDNHLYAVDAADGILHWEYRTGAAVWSTPAVVDDTVYVGSGDYFIEAIDATDGTPRWRHDVESRYYHWRASSPAVADGTVYVGSNTSHLDAVNAADGTLRWRYEVGDPTWSSPAVVDGTVFVGSQDDHLYAVDAADGTLQWRFETGDSVVSSPAVVDGTVYVGSDDNRLYALQ